MYPGFHIVIVDSSSTNRFYYDRIHEDEKTHKDFINNKQWELGAWYYALKKYNTYKNYMFIQDSLVPKKKIDMSMIDLGYVYSYHYNAKWGDGGYLNRIRQVYSKNNESFLSKISPNKPITGGAHNSFISSRKNAISIVFNMQYPYITNNYSKTKVDSWISERILGVMIDKVVGTKYNLNMKPYFEKIHQHRDY